MNDFVPSDHVGELLLFQPLKQEKDITWANVWVMDGPHSGDAISACAIKPKMLRHALVSKAEYVLGRLEIGPQVGAGRPWMLGEASRADIDLAGRFVDAGIDRDIT